MKITTFLILNFLFIGCTAKKLAIENADTLIAHQAYKKLPLNDSQKEIFKTDLIKLLEDSKVLAKTMLPIIDEIDLKQDGNLKIIYPKIEIFYKNLFKDISQFLSIHMAKLDDKQQKDFFKIMKEENNDILKKDISNHMKQLEERLEMFIGDLTTGQKDILQSYKPYFKERIILRVNNRKELHAELKKIYHLQIKLDERANLMSEAFAKYQARSFEGTKSIEILQKLWPTFTDKQVTHFKREAKEIKELIQHYIQVPY